MMGWRIGGFGYSNSVPLEGAISPRVASQTSPWNQSFSLCTPALSLSNAAPFLALFVGSSASRFIRSIPRSPRIGLLLGVLFLLHCNSTKPDSCEGIDCSGHGRCLTNEEGAAQCFCDEGYENTDGLSCRREAPRYDGSNYIPPFNPRLDMGLPPDMGIPPDMALPDAPPPDPCAPTCLTESRGRACRPGEETKIFIDYECPEGTTCEEGECKSDPEVEDASCPPEEPRSACRVTDIFDVVEQDEISYYEFDNTAYETVYACGDDAGRRLGDSNTPPPIDYCLPYTSGNWLAFTMAIDSAADFFRFDLKFNLGTLSGCSETPPPFRGVVVLFGDQRTDFMPDWSVPDCSLQPISDFSGAGISGSTVRVNVSRADYDDPNAWSDQYVDIARAQVWSCGCEATK